MKIKDKMTDKGMKTVRIIAVVLLFVFIALVTLIIGRPMIEFVSEPEKFRIWVEDKGFLGKLAFVGMVFFCTFNYTTKTEKSQ